MNRWTRLIMVAALAAGLAGPALAQDPKDPDDEWRDDPSRDQRYDDRWRDEDRDGWRPERPDHKFDDRRYDNRRYDGRRYDDRGRGDRGYRDRGRRVGPGYGAVPQWRIRQARQELRRIQWLAWQDGVITRWERLRIQQARQRLAWLLQRSYAGRSL